MSQTTSTDPTPQRGVGSVVAPPHARGGFGRHVIEIILRNPVLPILFIALPAFAVFVPDYATTGNLQNLLLQSAVLALLVAGGATVVISGNFDLSVEGTLAFSATVAAWLMYDKSPGSGFGLNGTLAVLVTVLVGIAVGVINGLMVEALHVNPFIVTLGTLLTLKGAAAIPTSAQTLYGLPSSYSGVARQAYFGVNLIVLIAAVLYAGIAVYMTRAVAARHIYAVGGNKRAARENGVNPLKSIIFVYCISGACAGVAGWLTAARLDSAGPGLGNDITFTVFASIVIGGIALEGGKGSLWGALGGVVLLGSIDNVLNLLAINPLYVNFVRGSVIVIAILLIVARGRLAAAFGIQERAV